MVMLSTNPPQKEEPFLVLSNDGADLDSDDYKRIEVGDTYVLENPVKYEEDPETRWLYRGDEGEVIEIDDDESPKRAKMRFMLEEGDEYTPSTFVEQWVEFEDIKAEIDWYAMSDDSEFNYENDLEYLQTVLQDVFGDPPWHLHIDAHNLTWRGLDGWKVISIETAKELVDAITPDRTEWYMRLWWYEERVDGELVKGIRASVSDHDVPMGSRMYILPVVVPQAFRDAVAKELETVYGKRLEDHLTFDDLREALINGETPETTVGNLAWANDWLTLEEIEEERQRILDEQLAAMCPTCEGRYVVPVNHFPNIGWKTCPSCRGTGRRRIENLELTRKQWAALKLFPRALDVIQSHYSVHPNTLNSLLRRGLISVNSFDEWGQRVWVILTDEGIRARDYNDYKYDQA